MNFRSLIPLILLSVMSLTGCATPARTPGVPPGSVVMLIKVRNEKKPQRIVIELNESAAPQTVANFKALIARRYYDGMRFHRFFPHQLVQTGDPKARRWIVDTYLQKLGLDLGDADRSGTGGPGYTVPAEIRLKLEKGTVATARLPDIINPTRASNGSQFFVCLESMPQLNGQYTAFGKVTQGLEVLDAISGIPTNSNDFPTENVVIESIRLE